MKIAEQFKKISEEAETNTQILNFLVCKLQELDQRTCEHKFEKVEYENRKECKECGLSKFLE